MKGIDNSLDFEPALTLHSSFLGFKERPFIHVGLILGKRKDLRAAEEKLIL